MTETLFQPGVLMSRIAVLSFAVVLVGCAKKETPPAADTTAALPPPAATISLGDVAGKWTVTVKPEMGDSTLLTYVLDATADMAGWTITLPNRTPQPVRVVAVEGDSIVTESGPYESILRPGVQVTTRSVLRLQDGKLMGNTVAHFQTTAADSVLRTRTEGTRAP